MFAAQVCLPHEGRLLRQPVRPRIQNDRKTWLWWSVCETETGFEQLSVRWKSATLCRPTQVSTLWHRSVEVRVHSVTRDPLCGLVNSLSPLCDSEYGPLCGLVCWTPALWCYLSGQLCDQNKLWQCSFGWSGQLPSVMAPLCRMYRRVWLVVSGRLPIVVMW